jgi:hypothetical protein
MRLYRSLLHGFYPPPPPSASSVIDSPSFTLDTNVFNVATRGGSPSGPNRMYWTDWYANAAAPSNAPIVDASGSLSSLMASISATSPQRADTAGAMHVTWADLAATSDPAQFNAGYASPRRELALMSAKLLNDRGQYKETMYGALVPLATGAYYPNISTGVIPDASCGGVMGYVLLHNTSAAHGSATFMNVMNSALYRRVGGSRISAISHPLPATFAQNAAVQSTQASSVAIIVVIAFSFIPAAVASYVVRERESGSKAQQLLAGVSLPAYWICTYLFDNFIYLGTALVSIGITAGLGGSAFSLENHRLAAISAIFIFFGPAVISFTYLLQFMFKKAAAATATVLMLNAACFILVLISFLLVVIPSGCPADPPLRWIFRLVPGYSLGNAILQIASMDILPAVALICDPSLRSSRVYDALDQDVAGANIIYLAVLGPGYLLLTVLIDIALTYPSVRAYLEAPPRRVEDRPVVEDSDVVAEKARVAASLGDGESASGSRAIQIAGLRKVFSTLEGTPKVAVRDLWLGLEVGDVFGFLGVNGAGERRLCGPTSHSQTHRTSATPSHVLRQDDFCADAHRSTRADLWQREACRPRRCDATGSGAPPCRLLPAVRRAL